MIIDCKNKESIKDLYIHDSIFDGYCYNYSKRQISLSCENSFLKKRFDFIFNNVIFSSMQSCSFWHGGNSILDIYLEENTAQMNQLLEIQNSNQDLYEDSYIDKGINYLSVGIKINSGDMLFIICEKIEFLEEKF